MIEIGILSESRYPVDKERLRVRIKQVLARHKLVENVALDVLIVGKRKMSTLHKKYMNLPGATNVLSFPLNDPTSHSSFVGSPDGVLRLGDIVICYPVALEEALAKQVKVQEQLEFLAEHGLMHLLGFHHE